ncbi:MAG: hypothetical protein Q9172_002890 [Xanthocarpia lactea]
MVVVSGTFGAAEGVRQAPAMAVVVLVTVTMDVGKDAAPVIEALNVTVCVTVNGGADSFVVSVDVEIRVVSSRVAEDAVRIFVWLTVLVFEVVSVSVCDGDGCAVVVGAGPPSTATTDGSPKTARTRHSTVKV